MQTANKLKIDPNMYILELLDEHQNTIHGPEPVKQWIYLIYPSSCTRDNKPAIEFFEKESTY